MRSSLLVGSIVLSIGMLGCTSGSGVVLSSSAPGPSSNPTTINILFSNGLGNNGAQSFSPNPASVNQGATVMWHNSDTTTHHIVLNDGSLDTGDIAPGSSSPARLLSVSGGQYHCTIHPTMVGSINVMTNASPSPGPYQSGK